MDVNYDQITEHMNVLICGLHLLICSVLAKKSNAIIIYMFSVLSITMLTSNFYQIQMSKILNYRYCLWLLWLAGSICEYFGTNNIFFLEVKTCLFYLFIFWGENMLVILFSNGTLDSDWIHIPSRSWRQIESRALIGFYITLFLALNIRTDECCGFWWGQRFKTKE